MIKPWQLKQLRETYPAGTRVELISMDNPFNKKLKPGCKEYIPLKILDRGYDNAFFGGLLSEKMILKTDRGRTRWAWEKLLGHERNEALDCRNYALAALRVLDPDMDRVEARLRQKAEDRPKDAAPRTRKRSKTNRNVGGVNDWWEVIGHVL